VGAGGSDRAQGLPRGSGLALCPADAIRLENSDA